MDRGEEGGFKMKAKNVRALATFSGLAWGGGGILGNCCTALSLPCPYSGRVNDDQSEDKVSRWRKDDAVVCTS